MFQIKFKISIFLRDRRSLFNQWEEHREKKLIQKSQVKWSKTLKSCGHVGSHHIKYEVLRAFKYHTVNPVLTVCLFASPDCQLCIQTQHCISVP